MFDKHAICIDVLHVVKRDYSISHTLNINTNVLNKMPNTSKFLNEHCSENGDLVLIQLFNLMRLS